MPFGIGDERCPLLLALGEAFPGEKVRQVLVVLADQGGEEPCLLDAVLFPDRQRLGLETLDDIRKPAWYRLVNAHLVDHVASRPCFERLVFERYGSE